MLDILPGYFCALFFYGFDIFCYVELVDQLGGGLFLEDELDYGMLTIPPLMNAWRKTPVDTSLAQVIRHR